ncbi:LamG domain-containing protein [Candidatus Bathyarchaeota archaeon]|nr:LamG domain-containing protein [Candidatus Bathyarchaeota archaeon]
MGFYQIHLETYTTFVHSGTVIGALCAKWHHIAGVYDGTKIYLDVDGVLDNFKETAWLISISEHPVLIGGNAERTERYWNGLIDDVRIYSCALNEAEIKALYEGKEPPCAKE